jgi:hypothetical protein
MAAERRRDERQKRRLTCRVGHEGQRFSGIVLDISPTGLFIQTTSPIPPGSTVVVELPRQGTAEAFEVRARVARRRRVPQRLASLMTAGIGLKVLDPPPAYAHLVQREDDASRAARGPEESPEQASGPELVKYRIRMTRRGSPRSRTLVLEATSEEEVRTRLARDLGADWDLVELEEA